MLRVNNIDLSPRKLLQNSASPQGPLPPGDNARGAAQGATIVVRSLLTKTFQQVNTARVNGVGGKVDLLG
ncbi:MAG: hypothetical protein O7G87_06770 [bacterium]|nr:hypothetical protein [bacterium]